METKFSGSSERGGSRSSWHRSRSSSKDDRRFPGRWMLRLPIFLAAVAALAFLALPPSDGTPGAEATDQALTIVKKCSPEATIGGLVQYQFDIANVGADALDRVSVEDTVLGDITAGFPDPLDPGEATIYEFYVVQESDWTPLQPLPNTVTATYRDPSGVDHVASDDCSVDIPHLTITKTATANPDGTTTFTFTLTNDGNVPLRRYKVQDNVLGDLTALFPFGLAVGETVVVEKTAEAEPCKNTVEAFYQSVPRASTVYAQAKCTPPPKGSITLTKIFKVGPFAKPTKVCFSIDPPGGIDPQEQCATSFDPGPGGDEVNVVFRWRELPFGTYDITETLVEPPSAYVPIPPIEDVTIDCANPDVVIPPAATTNPLQPGTLQVEKLDASGDLWSTPAVTFHVCRGSLADCTPTSPTYVQSIVVGNGNPNPSLPITLAEDFYTVCEVVPDGYTPDPERCQVVQVFAGDTDPSGQPAPAFVSFKNITEGAGCTPGYWRNHLDAWGPTGLSPSDDFDSTFGVDLFDPDINLEQAIWAKGGGVKKIARHGTAALLSALHPGVAYPFTAAEVIAAVQAGDVEDLVKANELGCPLD